jgi:hypothetical protein
VLRHFPGVDDVAEGLAHLLAVLVDDVPETEHVLVGLLAKDEGVHSE